MKKIKDRITKYFDLEKPAFLGWDEWGQWRSDTKSTRPFAYFVMETIPDKFDDVKRFVLKPIEIIRSFVHYRFINRYHILDTGLGPGYWDGDSRLLHGAFNLLVDFVEVDKAWMNSIWNTETQHKIPWYCRTWIRFKKYRSAESSIEYLKWEMTLTDSLHQKHAAEEIWILYNWWKYARACTPGSL
jgi:hypothetical protein